MDSDFWKTLDKVSDLIQIINFSMLIEDVSNTDLIKYLQHQDNDLLSKIIEQNEIIIQQNKELLQILKGGKQ